MEGKIDKKQNPERDERSFISQYKEGNCSKTQKIRVWSGIMFLILRQTTYTNANERQL